MKRPSTTIHNPIVVLALLCFSVITFADDNSKWSERELRVLSSLLLHTEKSSIVSASNSVADNKAAAEFGEALFFDARLSANDDISCATCHDPDKRFTDGLNRSRGTVGAMRNSPTLVGLSAQAWFYWDGRRDSLWSQALLPLEAGDEMASSRLAVLDVIASNPDYRRAYEVLFGPLPNGANETPLPKSGGPYAESQFRQTWQSLPLEVQRNVNTAFSNIGKAIAAYEHTLAPEATRFDAYVRSLIFDEKRTERSSLTRREIAGLRLFIDAEKTQCLQCHNGATLSNGGFHNVGSGVFSGPNMDFGREIGLRAVLMDEFNCLGLYSDADPLECSELRFLNRDSHIPLKGAFKVPTLRGLGQTAPYFHDGRFATLAEVLKYYNAPPAIDVVGAHELRPMNLTVDELRNLEHFLRLFSDDLK